MHSKFVEDSKRFFKFALSKEDNGWKTIENYIKQNRYQIRSFCNNLHWDSVVTSVEFCEILLNTVKNHNCDNKTLITSLTDIITVFSINNSNFRDYINKYGDYIECAINNLEANSCTSVFGEDEGFLQLNALLGNYQLMDILIKYGLVKNFPRECPFLEARTMEIMRHLFFSTHRDDDVYAQDLVESTIFKLAGDQALTDKNSRNVKRFLLTALALKAVIYKLEDEFFMMEESRRKLNNYMRCLRLYFDVTPDPYVTLNEVKDFLQVWLTSIDKADFIDRYYGTYKELMPSSVEQFQPRKLTDLCRIQVREYLSSYMLLPMAVENVNLPEKLKDFISFNLR